MLTSSGLNSRTSMQESQSSIFVFNTLIQTHMSLRPASVVPSQLCFQPMKAALISGQLRVPTNFAEIAITLPIEAPVVVHRVAVQTDACIEPVAAVATIVRM